MCQVSGVRCQVLGVTCQVSRVTFFVCLQSGGASRWRVCYHRGLPLLVSTVCRMCCVSGREEPDPDHECLAEPGDEEGLVSECVISRSGWMSTWSGTAPSTGE